MWLDVAHFLPYKCESWTLNWCVSGLLPNAVCISALLSFLLIVCLTLWHCPHTLPHLLYGISVNLTSGSFSEYKSHRMMDLLRSKKIVSCNPCCSEWPTVNVFIGFVFHVYCCGYDQHFKALWLMISLCNSYL